MPINIKVVKKYLSGAGYSEFCSTTSPTDVLPLMIRNEPDLVLLDIQLPYEDGFAVRREMEGVAQLKKALVIAVTANVMAEDIERARAAGFDGFIGKPISHARFPEQIRRILAGAHDQEFSTFRLDADPRSVSKACRDRSVAGRGTQKNRSYRPWTGSSNCSGAFSSP